MVPSSARHCLRRPVQRTHARHREIQHVAGFGAPSRRRANGGIAADVRRLISDTIAPGLAAVATVISRSTLVAPPLARDDKASHRRRSRCPCTSAALCSSLATPTRRRRSCLRSVAGPRRKARPHRPMATGVPMGCAGLGQPRPASGRADRPLLSTHRRRSLVQAAERMDLPGGQARAGRGCDGRRRHRGAGRPRAQAERERQRDATRLDTQEGTPPPRRSSHA